MFNVTFSVSHPTEGTNDKMMLNGNHERTQNIVMNKSKKEIDWMFVKYGNKTKPWNYQLNLPNVDGGSNGEWTKDAQNKTFEYSYGKKNCKTGEVVWESEPKRTLNIQNPGSYKGRDPYHAGSYWHNTDRVFIVNGQCNKADANFLG